MPFLLQRYLGAGDLTYGRLYYGDVYVCDTMEGKDLRLEDSIVNATSIVYARKKDRPAVPRGRYRMFNCYLDRYARKVPCVYGVECGFGCLVLIDSAEFDLGCICVGVYDYGTQTFSPSRETFDRIVAILDEEVEAEMLIK